MITSLLQAQCPVTLVAGKASISSSHYLQVQYLDQFGGLRGKLLALYQAWKWAVQSRANIFHIHDPELLVLVPFLKRLGSVVCDVHEDYRRSIIENRQGGRFSPLLSKIFSLFERIIATQCDAIVTATDGIAEKFNFHHRVIAVRNFASINVPDKPTSFTAAKQHDLVYVGGLARERGLFDMLDAVSQMPKMHLTLAGSFIDATVEREARNHAGWSQVKYLGYIDSAAVMELLQQSKIGLLPLWPQPRFLDSLPLKLFEYMSAGIPVVASNFSAWQPIIQNHQCGIMVEPINSAALHEACTYLLEHPTIAETMGQRGRQAVEQEYSWNAESQRLISLYQELAKLTS
jgi:hypothetical protein